MKPYVIQPKSRSPNRTEGGILEIVVGGDFNVWDHPIKINGKFVDPISFERITNYRGGTKPFTRLTVSGIMFGKHTFQLGDQQPFVFYVNPLY